MRIDEGTIAGIGGLILFLGFPVILIYSIYETNFSETSRQKSKPAFVPYQRSSAEQAGYNWAKKNDLFDHDRCGGYSQDFVSGCHEYVEEAMISAGCNEEQAWERCEFD